MIARHGHVVDTSKLPSDFPTQRHSGAFWEELGRTVATFGFLEEVLGRAILAYTGTRDVPEEAVEMELRKWLPTLEHALSDSLGALISSYEKAVRDHPSPGISNLGELVTHLREVARLRNVVCHASWRVPDEEGRSRPHFVSAKGEVFDSLIDVAFLKQLRESVVELTCTVISTVTSMGWQFPGGFGPGQPVYVLPADKS